MRTAIEIACDIIDTDDKIRILSHVNTHNKDAQHRAEIYAELMEAQHRRQVLADEERNFIYSRTSASGKTPDKEDENG